MKFLDTIKPVIRRLPKTAWFAVLFTFLTFFLLFRIDLQPHVDNDVFFSSDDPQFKSELEISKLFSRKDSGIIRRRNQSSYQKR